MVQGKIAEHLLAAVYEPMINVILQGSKSMTVGDKTLRYDPATYFVMSIDLPAVGLVHPAASGEPYLAMSVEDVRGIVGTPTVVVNGAPETMLQGAESTMGWQPNLRVPLRGVKELKGHMEFAIDMDLAGTEQLSVAPVGDSNHVELSSTWRSPLFAGRFLPR